MAHDSFLVSDEEYWQALGVEYVPTLYIDGNPTGFRQIQAKLRVREKVTEYRGHTSADDTIQAVSAASIQTTGGTYVFNSYECSVSRRRVNDAGFWRYTVKRVYRALYINGVWKYGTAESGFRS